MEDDQELPHLQPANTEHHSQDHEPGDGRLTDKNEVLIVSISFDAEQNKVSETHRRWSSDAECLYSLRLILCDLHDEIAVGDWDSTHDRGPLPDGVSTIYEYNDSGELVYFQLAGDQVREATQRTRR